MGADEVQRLAIVETKIQEVPEIERRVSTLETDMQLLTKELETVAKNLIPLTASLNKLVNTLNASKWVAMTLLAVAAVSMLGLKGAFLALLGSLG